MLHNSSACPSIQLSVQHFGSEQDISKMQLTSQTAMMVGNIIHTAPEDDS